MTATQQTEFGNLLQAYGCHTKEDYYKLIIESFSVGSNRNARNLYRLMDRPERKQFLTDLALGNYDSGLSDEQLSELFNLFI